jgi:hypothetical protein
MTPPIPVFAGRVDARGCFLTLEQQPRFLRWLSRLAGERVDLSVRKHQSKRSLDQNRYWFWAMGFLAHETWGEDDADARERMHYWLLIQRFGAQDIGGYTVPKRTSRRLSTAEFSEMIEWMVMFAARDLGVVVPLPNEISLDAYDEGAA